MQRSNQPPTPAVQALTAIVPVNKGGTGAANVYDAAVNLGGLNLSKLGVAGGLALGDSSGNVPLSALPNATVVGPTLSGSSLLSVNQVAQFVISNFDSLTNYTVSCSGGTVSLSGDTITYTAPGTIGSYSITVNGKVFNLTVDLSRPAAPIIAGTTSGTGSVAAVNVTGSTFAMLSGSGTHLNSDWELYSDANLGNLVASSLVDSANKTGWSSGNLALNTTYYIRCRYRANNGQVSDWSNTLSLTTKTSYDVGSIEYGIYRASDYVNSDGFAQTVQMDTSGIRMVVSAKNRAEGGFAQSGAVYIFIRSGNTWAQEAKIVPTAPGPSTTLFFGQSVAIDGAGTRVVIGATGYSGTNSNQGIVYVYSRSGVTWTKEASIIASDPQNNAGYGSAVCMDTDGLRIGVRARGIAYNGTTGAVYVYLRTGVTWAQEAKLTCYDGSQDNDGQHRSITFDQNANRIFIGAYTSAVFAAGSGCLTVYSRSGTTWTQEAQLGSGVVANNKRFGCAIDVDLSGTRIVISAYGDTQNGTYAGAAFVYSRSGVIWTLEQKLLPSDPATNDYFGFRCSINENGDKIIVGSGGDDFSSYTDAGSAYVFDRVNTTWTQTRKVTAAVPISSTLYGSPELSNGILIIAVPIINENNLTTTVPPGSFYYYG